MITLEINAGGRLFVKSQVTDYQYRGAELQHYNVYDFFADTYEAPITNSQRPLPTELPELPPTSNSVNKPEHPRVRGRRCHVRSRYQTQHHHAANKLRVVRSPLHRNIVNFVGRFFPSRDDPVSYAFYCASMLVLLKPWRNLATDLKRTDQSWAESFIEF